MTKTNSEKRIVVKELTSEDTTYYACSMFRAFISKYDLIKYLNGEKTHLWVRGPFKTFEEVKEYYYKKVIPYVDDDDYGIFALSDGVWYRKGNDGFVKERD